jgi:hypothetical protein
MTPAARAGATYIVQCPASEPGHARQVGEAIVKSRLFAALLSLAASDAWSDCPNVITAKSGLPGRFGEWTTTYDLRKGLVRRICGSIEAVWSRLLNLSTSRRVRGIIRASAEVALHIITDVDSFGVYERDALSWV